VPGSTASTERALASLPSLEGEVWTLDIGCGPGSATKVLLQALAGPLFALDIHRPYLDRLVLEALETGFSHRLTVVEGDMASMPFPEASFDLIWSEGALYNLGLDTALRLCRDLLRPGGHLVFTDAVWRKTDVPDEVRRGFERDSPTMGWTRDVLAIIEQSGFEVLGQFTLPDAAWWEDFYTPMRARVRELREKYRDDAEARGILDVLWRETDLHEAHSDCYAYEFFVTRRQG